MQTRSPHWKLAPALVLAAAFAFANGLNYGAGNLRQYLIHGLRSLDPSFLANDWFAAQTPPVHPLFTGVIILLSKVGPLNIVMGLANGLFSMIFAMTVYSLIVRFFSRPVLTLGTVLLIIVFSPLNSLGWSYIIANYFQPSTIGGVGLLMGIALLIHQRHLAASLVLAIAGLFHAGYLTWILVLVAAIVVFDWKKTSWSQRMFLCLPLIGPFAYHAPLLLSATSDPEIFQKASHVLHHIFVPQHFAPRTWGPTPFLQFATLMILGYAALKVCPPKRPLNRRAMIALGTCLGIVVVGALLTIPVRVPLVVSLFPYRIAAFLRLAAQIAIAAALIDCLVSNRLSLLKSIGLCTLLVAGLYYCGISVVGLKLMAQVMLPAIAIRIVSHSALHTQRILQPLRLGPAVAVILAIALLTRQGLVRKDKKKKKKPPELAELYDWCQTRTDKDAIFVVPPDFIDFRISARRAVVADWKCMPIRPQDTVEWYRRLTFVCGRQFQSLGEANRSYLELDTDRAKKLSREFGARYVVTYPNHRHNLSPLQPAFSNEAYAVVDLNIE